MPAVDTEPNTSTSLTPQQEVASPIDANLEHENAHNPVDLSLKSHSPRRVKVYLLQDDDWLDNGTGFCTGEVDSESHKPCFIVRNELDSKDVILQSFLEGSIQYQRQQETLIVWTDLSGKDLALSFQENEGCADLCDFIVRAQQENLSPQISLYYVLTAMNSVTMGSAASKAPHEITELITGPILYPPEGPSRHSLKDTLELITQGCNSMYSRFKVLSFLVETHYFDRLYSLFYSLEKAHDLEGLHLLNDIIKVTLYYNDDKIIEELVSSEDRVMGLVGILEYDRDTPAFKACHRDYLLDNSRVKMVIEIPLPRHGQDKQMDIFRRDFVLQYLKNVVLPAKLEDLAVNLLAGMIHSNQVEIIEFLKDPHASEDFLRRLFDMYDSGMEVSVLKKNDGVRLMHQYVVLAKTNLSNQLRDFYAILVKHGLLKMIKFALTQEEISLRVVGMEILTTVIDQDVALVNLVSNENKVVDEFEGDEIFKVGHNGGDTAHDEHVHGNSESIKFNLMHDVSLTLILGNLLLEDEDRALKTQTYEAIKSLLCSAVLNVDSVGKDTTGDSGTDESGKSEEHGVYVQKYFEAFYEQVAPALFHTFIDLAGGDTQDATLQIEHTLQRDPVLFQHLCDLISFCCHEHQSSVCRPFFTNSRALDGIVSILTLNVHVTLKLAVLRCFKSFILLDDRAFCCHMIENDIFAPFFTYFETVADEDSLPNSLCLDLLEIIKKRSTSENFGCLVVHISNAHQSFLESRIEYVSTGRDFLAAAEKLKEGTKDITATSVDVDPHDYLYDPQPSSPISHRFVGKQRSNGTLSIQNGTIESADHSTDLGDPLVKRKPENGSEGLAEKRSCLIEREIPCLEETSARFMAIKP